MLSALMVCSSLVAFVPSKIRNSPFSPASWIATVTKQTVTPAKSCVAHGAAYPTKMLLLIILP
jgi:hypothetical protein